MVQMSEALFQSGLLPAHIKNSQAAFAIVAKGWELGIPPMYALSNIVVIQGKPTANAELMAALIYRDHGDDALAFPDSSNDACTTRYKRRGWLQASSYTFTIADAKRAGLTGGNWDKYPAAMLRARCISAVARMAFPDTIGGLYEPSELGAAVVVDADGAVSYDDREVLQIRTTDDAAVDDNGQVVTADGEIVGQLQRIDSDAPDAVLFDEFKRRIASADTLQELAQQSEWAGRVGLTQPAAVEAFKARRKELRAASANVAQPELVGVE